MIYPAYTREQFDLEFMDGCHAFLARDFERAKARFSQVCHNVDQLFFKRQIDYMNAKQRAGELTADTWNPIYGVPTQFVASGTGLHRRVDVAVNANTPINAPRIQATATKLWVQERLPYVAGGVVAALTFCCLPLPTLLKGAVLLAGSVAGTHRAIDRLCKGV